MTSSIVFATGSDPFCIWGPKSFIWANVQPSKIVSINCTSQYKLLPDPGDHLWGPATVHASQISHTDKFLTSVAHAGRL